MKKQLLYLLFVTLLISSCSKNILYLNDIPPETLMKVKKADTTYRLQPYDYLYININTPDEKLNTLFQQYLHTNFNTDIRRQNSSYYLNGTMVNDSGYIMLPFIDTIKAAGLTVNQLQNIIQNRLDTIVNNAIVKVKLINFEVYFIGEINGSQLFYKDKVNILQAIAQAGGLPYSADKRHIYVIRAQDSVYQIYTLNLTNSHILENKNFFLQPQDIVYIKPRKTQVFRIQVQDYYFLVSLFTTTISFITLLLTLKK